uniref:Uncharacterized protein n=1 Tax=Ditylenchus dipsaci TaxID=166011 RepID=A0A915EK67_9BILA
MTTRDMITRSRAAMNRGKWTLNGAGIYLEAAKKSLAMGRSEVEEAKSLILVSHCKMWRPRADEEVELMHTTKVGSKTLALTPCLVNPATHCYRWTRISTNKRKDTSEHINFVCAECRRIRNAKDEAKEKPLPSWIAIRGVDREVRWEGSGKEAMQGKAAKRSLGAELATGSVEKPSTAVVTLEKKILERAKGKTKKRSAALSKKSGRRGAGGSRARLLGKEDEVALKAFDEAAKRGNGSGRRSRSARTTGQEDASVVGSQANHISEDVWRRKLPISINRSLRQGKPAASPRRL